jgi:hypothetical protein
MPGQPRQFLLPSVIDDHLERLLQAARDEGNRASRSDIVAALIWHAPTDGDAIGVIIRSYYRATKSDAGAATPAERRPGPRPFLGDVGGEGRR